MTQHNPTGGSISSEFDLSEGDLVKLRQHGQDRSMAGFLWDIRGLDPVGTWEPDEYAVVISIPEKSIMNPAVLVYTMSGVLGWMWWLHEIEQY